MVLPIVLNNRLRYKLAYQDYFTHQFNEKVKDDYK